MRKQIGLLIVLGWVGSVILQSCTRNQAPQSNTALDATTATNTGETGILQIRANGEDFVRQGFVSKDGWDIRFEHVYVNLAEVTAYQTEPPFDPESGVTIQPKQAVSLDGIKTVDLAEGDENAEPVLVSEVSAPVGRYNALSWQMVKANDGPAQGYPLILQGVATKDGQTVNFTLKLDEELAFTCGDFVGDTRKGILAIGNTADLEATFHFDHLFGDADAPADDALNTRALGFEPLAAIAQNGQLDADLAGLKANLSNADYTKLLAVLPSLGHVGEGHCQEMSGQEMSGQEMSGQEMLGQEMPGQTRSAL